MKILNPTERAKLEEIHPNIFESASKWIYPKPMSTQWDSVIATFESEVNKSFSFPPHLQYVSISKSFEEHMVRKIHCKDFLPSDCTLPSHYGTMQRILSYIVNCEQYDNGFKEVDATHGKAINIMMKLPGIHAPKHYPSTLTPLNSIPISLKQCIDRALDLHIPYPVVA